MIRTDIGGTNETFRTTNWQDILDLRTADPQRRQAAADRIIRKYWKPAYAYLRGYLRRKGQDVANDDAKDLTQGFFTEVLWGKQFIDAADPARGRFRVFLQTALRNYATDQFRRRKTQKRTPPAGLVSLDDIEFSIPDTGCQGTPEEEFTFAWASQLLADVLAAVEARCRRGKQGKHWEVFRRTIVEPTLTGAPKPPLSELCRELGIQSVEVASGMNTTVKRRFRAALEVHVRDLVSSDDEVQQEIQELMAILSRSGTRR